MATNSVLPDANTISAYGVNKDDHQHFGDLPSCTNTILYESNSELPSPSNYKSHFSLRTLSSKNYIYVVDSRPVSIFKKKTDITVGLDSLTLIYPFHSFF